MLTQPVGEQDLIAVKLLYIILLCSTKNRLTFADGQASCLLLCFLDRLWWLHLAEGVCNKQTKTNANWDKLEPLRAEGYDG